MHNERPGGVTTGLSSTCWAVPRSRSTARPAIGSAAGRAGRSSPSSCSPSGRRRGVSSPRCCSPRRTTRCGPCAGPSPRSAGASAPAHFSTAIRSSSTCRPAPSVDVDVLVHGHWRDGRRPAGPGGGPARRAERRRRRGVRGLAALAAAPAGRGLGVDPPRGRARYLSRDDLDPGHRPRRPRGADEPARREPPGPPDPALPPRRRRRGGPAAVRRVGRHGREELGVAPGAAVRLALRERRATTEAVDVTAIRAITEAGTAAVSAGPSPPASRRTRRPSGWPTAPRCAASGSRPGWCWPRHSSTPSAVSTRRGWRRLTEVGADRARRRRRGGSGAGARRARVRRLPARRYDRAERWLSQVLDGSDGRRPGPRR